jgi:hypothetical protein
MSENEEEPTARALRLVREEWTAPLEAEIARLRAEVDAYARHRSAKIEAIIEVLLSDGGLDMTGDPPGKPREDAAREVAEEIVGICCPADASSPSS